MSKIKSFDRTHCTKLREELNTALKALGEKYGVNIHAGNASYSDELCTFKVELATIGANGLKASKAGEDFKRYAKRLNMKEEHLGQEFKMNGKVFVLTGFKPRASKFPFIATNKADGQSYKLPSAVR